MTRLLARIDHWGDRLLPPLARLVFAGVLLGYYWSSALTKFDGPFSPSAGAFVQIYPRAMEAAGYDPAQLGLLAHLVVLAGGWAEFALPALILAGLLTRLSALGMMGFIALQSLTDVVGHGVDAATAGRWFDRASDGLILDQRALWVLLLAVLVLKGGGALALDRLIWRHQSTETP
jgi:putative oxidoreductase